MTSRMSTVDKIKKLVFKKIGLPRVLKVYELEDTVALKKTSIKYSNKSPSRFDIPVEFGRREQVDVPLKLRTTRHILSSVRNSKQAVLDLKNNDKDPKKRIEEKVLLELEKYIKSLNISCIGYTKVPQEYIFEKKAVAFENAIVIAMNMDNEKISTAPSKSALKNIWKTYDKLGVASNKIARYLRKKGFGAHASHPLGGIALYPRLAEKAGLGGFGRSGILITPINGPTLRLTAVYTNIENLPLNEKNEHDWIMDYCDKCGICVKECPPKAIYEEPIVHETGRVTHIDNEKCFPYFGNNFACTVCIKVCPFNKVDYNKLKENFENK